LFVYFVFFHRPLAISPRWSYIVSFRLWHIFGVEEISERAQKVEMGTHYAARNLIVWHPSVHILCWSCAFLWKNDPPTRLGLFCIKKVFETQNYTQNRKSRHAS
jgi:hypothetical protein